MNHRVTNHIHCLKPDIRSSSIFQQVAVTTAAETLEDLGVTIPDTTKALHLTADGEIRFADQDKTTGVDPTATKGHIIPAGGLGIYMDADRARNVKFIAVGTGSVNLNLTLLTE